MLSKYGPDLVSISELRDTISNGIHVVFISVIGCNVCSALREILELESMIFPQDIQVSWITFEKKSQVPMLGFKLLSGVPLVLSIVDGNLKSGWEGFAAFAPIEIKSKMVQEFLYEVEDVTFAGSERTQ